MSTRVRIVLPDDLLAELDQTAGKSQRSRFITEAVREKLARQRYAGHEVAGLIAGDEMPVWTGPEDVIAWLRASRQRDIERLNQHLTTWTEA